MSYSTYGQGAAMFPQLPDWAPNVNLTLSLTTSGTAYIDVTVSWRGASKTFRWQLAGGSENMSLVRLGEVNMQQSAAGSGEQMAFAAPGGSNEYTGNASASWYNAQGRTGVSTYQDYESNNNYDYTGGGEGGSGAGGPQYRTAESGGSSSVPRYTGSEDMRSLEENYQSGAGSYDGGSYDGGSYDSGSYSYREWKAGNKSKSRAYDKHNSGKRNVQGGEKSRKHLDQ